MSAKAQAGLGTQRFERYRAAYARVRQSEVDGYYLEGIALIDSLISDRLASRLGFLKKVEPQSQMTSGNLCAELLKPDAEQDPAFRAEVKRIQDWVRRRNDAIHATAKALKSHAGKSVPELLNAHRSVLTSGIERLKRFNALDVASRRASGARPAATEPGAFDDASRAHRRA